jgi:hypothetical protein
MRIDARHLLVVALAGCGIDAVGSFTGNSDPTLPERPKDDGAAAADAAPVEEASAPIATTDAGADGTVAPEPFFYVSTESTLYSFAPVSRTWKTLASLTTKCPYAYELAVDSDGVLYGASSSLRTIYKFDATFGCTEVPGPEIGDPWGWTLSFVPKSVFGTTTDTLVGYTFRDYYRVLPGGGTVLVTSNALDPQMQPSGDIVSMGDRAFVAITGSAECATKDCLIEVDPKTGSIVKNWGTFPGGGVWALAQHAGKIYGFRSTGEVYEATLATPLVVTTLPGPAPGLVFSGAGSSTSAPTN